MVRVKVKARKIPEWKKQEVEYLRSLIKSYKLIGVADLTNVPSAQLQQIRMLLRGTAVLRVTKNTLMRIALSEFEKEYPNIKVFKEKLEGSNIFIFTNMNPFELKLLLDKHKISAPAKPGAKVEKEIVIPAGNTGIPPGPILSIFGKLKIPTRIQEGTIWITKDVVVAKPGDIISPELASILQKLGIEPLEIGLKLKFVYDKELDRVLTSDELTLNIDEYKNSIIEAHNNAIKLAIGGALPIPDTLSLTIQQAYMKSLILATKCCIITKETLPLILQEALIKASTLASILSQKVPELGLQYGPPTEEKKEKEEVKEEKKEEKKEVSEEETLAQGLATLFG